VYQAVAAGEDLDKGAEVLDGDDAAFVGLADLDLAGEAGDELLGAGHGGAGVGVDADSAVVIHVDLGAGFGTDALDGFAAGADQQADLILRDLHHLDLRGVLGDRAARGGQDLAHKVEDLRAGVGGTVDRVLEEGERQAGELEVQLEAGDALASAAKFEVHVAEVVLGADDVGEELVTQALGAGGVVLGDEADADAGDGGLEGHTGVKQGKGAAANGGHGSGAVGLHHLRGDA